MTNHKGFALLTIVLVILGIMVLGGAGYYVVHSHASAGMATNTDDGDQMAPGDHPEEDHSATEGMHADAKVSVSWKFADAGEADNIPYTNVMAVINGTPHAVGKFQGSCKEVGANGGIDGKGLLAGELSAAQCWFAGGGDEVGVFAHEDGGVDIMTGTLEEPIEGSAGSRGNFKVQSSLKL